MCKFVWFLHLLLVRGSGRKSLYGDHGLRMVRMEEAIGELWGEVGELSERVDRGTS